MRSDDSRPLNPVDPDQLLAFWQALLAKDPHLHLPQAAALLGVSEAELLATRVGTGALRMSPQLPLLLAGIERWQKVFVVASSRLGAGIAILRVDQMQQHASQDLELRAPEHRIHIDLSRVDSCYLFDNLTHHGHSLSLCWFDSTGQGLGKLILRSRSGQDVALPRLMEMVLPEQSRSFFAAGGGKRIDGATWRTRNPYVEQRLLALLDGIRNSASTELRICGTGVDFTYRGPVPSFSQSHGALHLGAHGCKAHLRAGAALEIRQEMLEDGRKTLRVDAGNGSLYVTPDTPRELQRLITLMEASS